MARDMAIIKGAEVKSVHVGETWITVTVRIPFGAVFSAGKKRSPKPLKHRSDRSKKAWIAIRKSRTAKKNVK